MKAFNHLRREIELNTFEIGSTCWVDVTHINTPHSFYVRPRTYNVFLRYINARGKHVKASEIGIGDIVIFSSKTVKTHVRGKILHVEKGAEPLYSMHAIDIGCFEQSVPLSKIWRRHHRSDLPSLVTHCQLSDCAPRDLIWDDRAIDAMKSTIAEKRAIIFVTNKTSDAVLIELYNSCYHDVSVLLAHAGYTMFGAMSKRCLTPNFIKDPLPLYYPRRKLLVKNVIHVRMQSGSLYSKFYVAPINEYKTYLKNMKNFTAEAKTLNIIDVADINIGMPVAIYSEISDKYERGIVQKIMIQSSKVQVHLVDWGKEVVKPAYHLKPLTKNNIKFLPRAICCSLHKSQSVTDNMLPFSSPGAEFQITIEEVGTGDYNPHSVIISPLQK